MVKINNIREKILEKKYISLEIDGESFNVYIVNDNVQGIYKVNEDGTSTDVGRGLSSLTGFTKNGFLKRVNRWLEEHKYNDYEEYDYDEDVLQGLSGL